MLTRILISLTLILGTLTKIPPSPFDLAEDICTQINGQIYEVDGFPSSPYFITPFQDLFANPGIAVPKDKVCRSDSHCLLSYQTDAVQSQHRIFDNAIPSCKDFGPTNFLTYGGKLPAETIIVPQGVQTLVRLNNKISNKFFPELRPCTNPMNKGGRPINIHLHGSQSLAPFDGWAEDLTCANETKDYVFPNQEAKTLWYHDHSIKITFYNVYSGTAGAYIISSKIKDGGCGEPYNLEDIQEKIMILGDKVIDSRCQLYSDTLDDHKKEFHGDINTVNDIPFPLMPVDPKWYRFRFLNAAPSRTYKLLIKDQSLNTISHLVCQVFATDGGFKTKSVPFPLNGMTMGVAERYEVACDFSAYKGQTLYIWNNRVQDLPYFCYSHLIAKIVVSTNDASAAPKFNPSARPDANKLLAETVLSPTQLANAQKLADQGVFHRQFVFGRRKGQWRINGQNWDTFRLAASDVGINTWQIWKLKMSGSLIHPIHIHLIQFFILRREVGSNKDLVEQYEKYSGKDVVFAQPGADIYVVARYGAHKGDYMFHCHNLIHQDDLMLRAFRVIDVKSPDVKSHTSSLTSARFALNPFLKIVYGNFQFSDPLSASLIARKTSTVESLTVAAKKALNGNFYAVFYPTSSDRRLTVGFTNPWQVLTCYK